MAQEAVTNALRHARDASRIEVRVAADATSVRLRVSDDGTTVATRDTGAPGYGIIGMIERAGVLGGTNLSISAYSENPGGALAGLDAGRDQPADDRLDAAVGLGVRERAAAPQEERAIRDRRRLLGEREIVLDRTQSAWRVLVFEDVVESRRLLALVKGTPSAERPTLCRMHRGSLLTDLWASSLGSGANTRWPGFDGPGRIVLANRSRLCSTSLTARCRTVSGQR